MNSCWCTSVSYPRVLKWEEMEVLQCPIFLCADVRLSGQGHRVSAAFEGAAVELQGSEVKLAVVDAVKEKDLAKELNAAESSEIRLYVSGDKHSPVVCPGMCK